MVKVVKKEEIAPAEITFMLPYVKIIRNVSIRKCPGQKYGSLGIAKKGDILNYYGYTYDNGWLLVEFDHQTGWVSPKSGVLNG